MYIGLGIVFGAGLGMIIGLLFLELHWGLIGGAALGMLAGIVLDNLKGKE